MHINDKSQLEQWYNDLTARLAKTNQPHNSTYVAALLDTVRFIGDVLDKELPVITFKKLFSRKKP